jgi:hypothetical protein
MLIRSLPRHRRTSRISSRSGFSEAASMGHCRIQKGAQGLRPVPAPACGNVPRKENGKELPKTANVFLASSCARSSNGLGSTAANPSHREGLDVALSGESAISIRRSPKASCLLLRTALEHSTAGGCRSRKLRPLTRGQQRFYTMIVEWLQSASCSFTCCATASSRDGGWGPKFSS